MANPRQLRNLIFNLSLGAALAALAIAFLLIVVATPAQAQTFNVLHNFTGGSDGGNPYSGLTKDKAGNLYGTALYYGIGYGTAFQLKHKGSGWVFNLLYSFAGGNDGAGPQFDGGALVVGPDGTIYGTTNGGGGGGCQGSGAPYPGCGTVFNLRPSPTACKAALCPWNETVLYRFTGANDGYNPEGALIFDQAGNIYGTTIYGRTGPGTLFELTPSGGGWSENIIFNFGSDGHYPISGVILDSAGNFYGTTYLGGSANVGTAFQLVPSNGGLTENLHYSFQGGSDGSLPVGAGLIPDGSGNLYGAAPDAGTGGGGTVFELSPGSGGSWAFTTLYSFTGSPSNGNGCGPWGLLVMEGGNIYGTTKCDGVYGYGNVFELTPSNGGWTYTDLYDFTGGNDGAYPISNVVLDASGNLYGTAYGGGSQGLGVVWEITFP